MVEALRRGNSLFIDLTASNKNSLRIELPLNGFSKAFDMALNRHWRFGSMPLAEVVGNSRPFC